MSLHFRPFFRTSPSHFRQFKARNGRETRFFQNFLEVFLWPLIIFALDARTSFRTFFVPRYHDTKTTFSNCCLSNHSCELSSDVGCLRILFIIHLTILWVLCHILKNNFQEFAVNTARLVENMNFFFLLTIQWHVKGFTDLKKKYV